MLGTGNPCLRRGFVRAFSSGLMNRTSTDMYYAGTLDFPEDLRGFTQPGLMWKAVQQDAKVVNISPEDHLSHIKGSMEKFFTEGGVFNREELLGAVHNELAAKGTFTLLLGGKNVGKSMVMRSVAEQYNSTDKGPIVLQINARVTGPWGRYREGYRSTGARATMARYPSRL